MKKWCGIIVLCLIAYFSNAQESYRVVSYNVENLFDTQDDPLTQDSDFTPEGKYHWNREKYRNKLLNIGRTITASGEGSLPVLVALCEIENASVLDDLLARTSLRKKGYRYLHRESPDTRGIDVALLYQEAVFQLLSCQFLRIDSLYPQLKTREILYACGLINQCDTLHLFVCHLPSMIGGEKRSEWKREAVARLIRNAVNSIFQQNAKSNIFIMGDFNGIASSSAQTRTLRTNSVKQSTFIDTLLYNTSTGYQQSLGSYKYRGRWQIIDHIVVSGSLLNGHAGLQSSTSMQIFDPDFLLEEDASYVGYKPRRTFSGMKYNGGTSDHLPVYIDLIQKK